MSTARYVDQLVLQANTAGFVGGLSGAGFALQNIAALSRAVGAAVSAPTQAFLGFQEALNNVAAVSGATSAEMGSLRQIALDMGASTKFSAQEAAEAQSFLAMAGLSVRETMDALPGTLQLAAAGNLDLAEAADIATNVMSGYGLAVADLARVNDVIATTAASANTNVQQVGVAMSYAAPVASAAGLSFEEASAAVGMLSNAGIQADMAGTSLRGMLTKLLNPSNAAAGALDRLGVTAFDSSGKMRPFADIVADFGAAGLSAGDAMEIFGQRAGPGMLALVSQGAPALRDLTANLNDSEGAAQRMADTQQMGLVGAMTQLKSAAGNLLIVLGEGLEPVTSTLVVTATEAAREFGAWVTEGDRLRNAMSLVAGVMQSGIDFVSSYGRSLGALTAGVAAGATAWASLRVATMAYRAAAVVARTAQMALNIVLTANPIGILVAGIGAAVAAYVYWREEINGFLAGAWNGFVGALEAGLPFLRALGGLAGIEVPDNLDSLRIATETATGASAEHSAALVQEKDDQAAAMQEAVKARALVEQLTGEKVALKDATGRLAAIMSGDLAPALAGGPASVAESAQAAKLKIEALAAAEAKLGENGNAALVVFRQNLLGFTASLPVDVLAPPPVPVSILAAHEARMGQLGADSTAAWQRQVRTSMNDVPAADIAPPPLTLATAGQLAGGGVANAFLADVGRILSPDALSALFTSAFTGGGGVLGALKGIGAQLAGALADAFLTPLTDTLSRGMSSLVSGLFGGGQGGAGGILGQAVGLAGSVGKSAGGAFMGAAGGAGAGGGGGAAAGMMGAVKGGLGAVGGAIKGALAAAGPIGWAGLGIAAGLAFFKGFGGPSRAEKASRQMEAEVHEATVNMARDLEGFTDDVSRYMVAGWKKMDAETIASFRRISVESGKTAHEGWLTFERYHKARMDNRNDEARAILGQLLDDYSAHKANEQDKLAATVAGADGQMAAVGAVCEAEADCGDQRVAVSDRVRDEKIAAEEAAQRAAEAKLGAVVDASRLAASQQIAEMGRLQRAWDALQFPPKIQKVVTVHESRGDGGTTGGGGKSGGGKSDRGPSSIQSWQTNLDGSITSSFAQGGFGRVTRPSLFLAGEAGPESFWFSGARNQVPLPGVGGGDRPPIIVHVTMRTEDDEVVAERLIRVDPRVRDRLYGGD